MFKKLFLLLIIAFSVSILSSFDHDLVPVVHAQPVPGEDIDSGGFMFDLTAVTNQGIEGTTRQGWIRQGIGFFFERIVSFLAAIIGTLSVLMMVWGGFLMLSAGGSERHEQGKNYVKYALIGLVVTLSAYILVTLVQLLIASIYG